MPSRYKRKTKKKKTDETAMTFNDLMSILGENDVAEIAKNVLNDQMNVPPPMWLQAGEGLYTHGSTVLFGGSEDYWSIDLDVPVEKGKEIIDQEIDWGISDEVDEKIKELGLNRDEVVSKIGLFILSNVNGMTDLHNYACTLFDEIGHSAWDQEEGTIASDDGAEEYMRVKIDELAKKAEEEKDVKLQYYYQGFKKHFDALVKDGTVKRFREAIKIFNSLLNDLEIEGEVYGDTNWEGESGDEAIEMVFKWMIDPISYLRDIPDMEINLVEYEKRYGKLPRQPMLPGVQYEPKKEVA